MRKRKWLGGLLLIALALVLAACGTGTADEENAKEIPEDQITEKPDPGTGLSGGRTEDGVESMIEQLDGERHRYTVTNQTEKSINFEFTSGQRFDFSLTAADGEQLYLMSSVSSFIQALGEESLEPGGELSYEFDIPPLDLEAGTYTIEAWLTPSSGQDHKASTEYIVE